MTASVESAVIRVQMLFLGIVKDFSLYLWFWAKIEKQTYFDIRCPEVIQKLKSCRSAFIPVPIYGLWM